MRPLVQVVASAAVGMTALAACGGGSSPAGSPPSGNPVQVVAAAATATQSAGTARADIDISADFSGIPGQNTNTIRVTGTGAFDVGRKLARLDMDLGTATARHIKVFADGSTVYINTAGLGLTGAKPWIKMDASTAGAGLTPLSVNPFSGAQLLSKLTNVKVVGNGTVRGAATTQYRGTLDMAAALSQMGGSTARLGQLSPALENALAGTTMPVDVWIDGQDRLRRLAMNVDLAPFMRKLFQQFGATSDSSLPPDMKALISIDFSLYDFGANLDLTPPPAGDVGPAPPNFQLPGAGTSL
ncbi:MAG TPA: LppX_LprAFG lipoprotein [Acidimicrobiales bacterium]|nr:LppX_LprAFG lipoprotein [Acidimicrobiales bacterium]